MKISLIVITLGALTFFGCSDGETKKQLSELTTELVQTKKQLSGLTAELEQTKTELNNCSNELAEIKNTAENRFIRAQKLLSENNLQSAKIEFQGIVDNFKGTKDEINASNEIEKIEKIVEQNRIETERKKAPVADMYILYRPTNKTQNVTKRTSWQQTTVDSRTNKQNK